VGMRRQLREAVTLYNADRVLIVDVGGDLLACGDEPKLSSPTADAMVLAATNEIGVPVLAVVVGLGLDGENISDDAQSPLKHLSSDWHGLPDELSAETARRFSASFGWSPSEATGLAYMVARGWRGTAEIRRDGQRVVLDSASAKIRLFDAYALLLRSRLAQDLDDTTSLEDVERVVSEHGFLPEREIERFARLNARRSMSIEALAGLEEQLLHYSEEAARRSVDYLTIRRIGELLRVDSPTLRALVQRLMLRYPHRLRPPAWRVRENGEQ